MILPKEEMASRWINKNAIGARFNAGEVAKFIDLIPKSAGSELALYSCVKNAGRAEGNTKIWGMVEA